MNVVHRSCSKIQPELVNAARFDPTQFSQLLRQFRQTQTDAELERQQEMDRFEADPSDLEAQQRIEEAARQLAVSENLEYALEHTPELFTRCIML